MVSDESELKVRYGQIIGGISPFYLGKEVAYIKHFSSLEQGELDTIYSLLYEKAVSKGLPTEYERLKILSREGTWGDKEEKEIEDSLIMAGRLRDTKKNLVLISQIEDFTRQIADEEKKLETMRATRSGLVGITAENFAKRQLNEQYLYYSLFKDKGCIHPFFDRQMFDSLELEELNVIARAFNKCLHCFNDDLFKKIGLSSFFQNIFTLCDDNIYHFYGKPIIELTFFQIEIAKYARFFKHILSSERKPPDHIRNNPDKLIEWFDMSGNAEKMIDATNSSNVAIMGATAEDLESMASNKEQVVSLGKLTEGKTAIRGMDFFKLLKN